jgi:SAM-dependent methyltransferase
MKIPMSLWLGKKVSAPKISILRDEFNGKEIRVLDVGAGNHSASLFKSQFPQAHYYGLDLDKSYNNEAADFLAMSGFYELDLTKLDFSMIPDGFFDVIVCAHVIEHLPNGDLALTKLCSKLKTGGVFYIEWPHPRSLYLPSMRGSLNFFDDRTHLRIYDVIEVCNCLMPGGVYPIKFGTRRNWWHIAALPLLILRKLIRRLPIDGSDFWDLLGFAAFVYGRKR